MPVLKFLCPTTRTYFDSGVRVDETSASAARLNIIEVQCPNCFRQHRFLLADGVLDGHDLPPQDVAINELAGTAPRGKERRAA